MAHDIEDIYELSPLQQGLLFESLYAPRLGVNFEQLVCTLEGDLDYDSLRRAWQSVVDANAALRTSFHWEDLEKPLQIVHQGVEIALRCLDGSGRDEATQREHLERFLAEDREQEFDYTAPPLMRLTLIRLSADTHVFCWSFHHILLDGWSLSLVLSEVFRCYEAFRRGVEPVLRPAPPFGDYIAWLLEQDPAGDDAFWRRMLHGFRSPITLQAGRAVPVTAGGLHEWRELYLTADATDELERFARRHRLTPNILAQGAWGLLLSRYTRENDIVFGVVFSGRPAELKGVEAMVGLFLNTLPVRVRVASAAKAIDWLQELLARHLEYLQHEHTPLPQVQRWSEVPAGTPLFGSLLAFENYPFEDALPAATDLVVRSVAIHERTGYPLTLKVTPLERLRAVVSYDTRRYDSPTITRLLEQYRTLLAGLVASPERCLSDLPLLSASERHQLLVEWNDTAVSAPELTSFPRLFARQAACRPNAAAVICGGRSVSYGELDGMASRLVRALSALGVGRGSIVGVMAERGVELLAAMLGILASGAAYMPLGPRHPIRQLQRILEQSGTRLLLATREMVPRLSGLQVSSPVRLELLENLLEGDDGGAGPVPACSPEDIAYVIFTSGSTGLPKGVMVEHRGLLNHLRAKISDLGLSAADTVAQTAPQTFDISIWQSLAALQAGGRVEILSDEVAYDPARLLAAVDAREISVLQVVPSFLRLLLEEAQRAGKDRPRLTSLRWMIATGEALPPDLHAGWRLLYSSVPLLNAYGPTECSDNVTHCVLDTELATSGYVTIGRPLRNIRFHVLSPDLLPVPLGAVGELCVAGAGVARGYVNDPARTAEVFLPDLQGEQADARCYRTGDLVRHLPDGRLEYLGRSDHQVKIRGLRIEPGQIEAVLRAHPRVTDAVVVVREDRLGALQLVAYISSGGGARPTAEELRDWAARELPEYMVPPLIVSLDTLPLNTNGKVDRRALPAPVSAASPRDVGDVPGNAVEELVCEIWGDILAVERIGIHENFFELGGHSLLATQVISRLRTAFGVALPVRALFDWPTVAELARAVTAAMQGGEAAPLPPLERVGPGTRLPLSFGQQRLWFLDRWAPGSPTYNIPLALRCEGCLRIGTLAQALSEIVRRHESLRTTFEVLEDEPEQRIHPAEQVRFPCIDLSSLAASARQREGLRLLGGEAQRGFDLTLGPVFRVSLLRLQPEEHLLLATLHHIISDGWSLGVLTRELAALYPAYTAEQPSPLPELTIQYADFAVWQRRWLSGEALARELAYWRERLAGAPPALALPTDRPRPSVRRLRGKMVPVSLPRDLTASLRELGRKEGATLFMALLAAFQSLLGRWACQEDVCVGVPIAGRNRAETEGLIGFFVNTLVLRANLSGDPGFRHLLAQVRESALCAHEHQELPFEKLIEELRPERSSSHSPLFQVTFTLRGETRDRLAFSGLRLTTLPVATGTAKFDLSLALSETSGGLDGCLELADDLFDTITIRRLAGHLYSLLCGIVADPERRLADQPLLTAAEEHQALREWNATARVCERQRPVHELFAERAKVAPEAPAVVCAGRRLTYRELDLQAASLAGRLRRLGVGPESRVGILLGRGSELVLSVLAVLKVGAAYVPLNPAYPAERLRFQLADAEVIALLTTREVGGHLPAGLQTLFVDTPEVTDANGGALQPATPVDLDQLAYVIYTSGSTGASKGVEITHRGLLNLVSWHRSAYGVTPADRASQVASPAFDASVWEIWPYLTAGASLFIPDDETSSSPAALVRYLAREAITIAFLPTPLAEEILAERWPQALALRVLLTGGDRLERRPPAGWPCQLINHYGPTEASVVTTCSPVSCDGESLPPIGRPIDNVQVYLLSSSLQPVPGGVPGELYVGGDGLARSYLGRPELTAESFVPDPFSRRSGARLYRSGDLARHLPSGELQFLGRADRQLKLRGLRIEPGEIEAVLMSHPALSGALVMLRETLAGSKHLVAYVVSAEGTTPPAAELRAALALRLPEHMIPGYFVALDRFPFTPNGKLDRDALPAPDMGRQGASFVPPQGDLEAALAAIWEEVLGGGPVGREDDFFALGGHSLTAVRLLDRIHSRLGIQLPLASLFSNSTLARQADMLRAREAHTQDRLIVPLATGGAGPAIFWIHPIGGNVLCYRDLARCLGTGFSVYGIQSVLPTPGANASLEAMAERYVREIRRVRPEGSYCLGGWSFGALVAFEMARRLREEGAEVAPLALMDPPLPQALATSAAGDRAALLRWFRRDLAGLGQGDMEIADSDLLRAEGEFGIEGEETAVWRPLFQLFCTNVEAMQTYHLAPYAGRAVLFLAPVPGEGEPDRRADAWRRLLAGETEVYTISGDHYTCLREPHVAALADRLGTILREAWPCSLGLEGSLLPVSKESL